MKIIRADAALRSVQLGTLNYGACFRYAEGRFPYDALFMRINMSGTRSMTTLASVVSLTDGEGYEFVQACAVVPVDVTAHINKEDS